MSSVSPAPILEMRNISKAFGGVQALRDVSFTCQPGKVHAVVGENGAGKSTLIKILAGAYQADSGEIIYKGQRHASLTTRQALDSGIRIIYQELNLIPYLSVAENIFLGREPRTRVGLIDGKRLYEQAGRLLKRLSVQNHRRTPVGELTVAGQRRGWNPKAFSPGA